ncbi:MAG: EamA family transporter RarD [Caulobacter sp.]|nr:EamA family transporter RarD [Caulobacter sp.]
MPPVKDEGRAALIASVGCYSLWGLLPLWMYALKAHGVGPMEITAERAVWAVLWAGGLVLVAGKRQELAAVLRQPKTLALLLLSALLIGANWLVYVLAVNSGRTLDASLGYYINPLMNMAAGAIFFRERIDRFGFAAIAMAAVGVIIQTAVVGHPPFASLALALTFCAYGLIRKQVAADAQTGLFVETAILTLPGLAFVVWLETRGMGHLRIDPATTLLILCSGPLTVAPLALFAWAARRMPLVWLGFIQFIAPTLQFIVGVAAGEAFTPLRGLAFAFIWVGVAIFAYGAWRRTRRLPAAIA